LTPGADYLGGAAAWAADRARWLVPRGAVLAPMLRGLHAAGDGRAPRDESATAGRADPASGAHHRTHGGRS